MRILFCVWRCIVPILHARHGCDAYYRHNQELMFYQRKTAIIRELEQLSQEL